jgi:bacterioferritin
MGILSDDKQAERNQLVEMLTKAYWMEIETVMSYTANSINPDGVRAREVIDSLEQDIQEELGHSQRSGSGSRSSTGPCPGHPTSSPSRPTCSRLTTTWTSST